MTEINKNQNDKLAILVTGAHGFLGKQCVATLRSDGVKVTTFGRSACEINQDITQPFVFQTDFAVDGIVHAAGKAHIIPQNEKEEKVFFDVNVQGTKNLCAAIDRLSSKPKFFVFVSTVSVYGLQAGELIKETQALSGKTPYAESKIQAEQYLREWSKRQGINLTILRLPLIAGANAPGNLGSMISGIKSNRYLSIGKANARKSIVWAEDVAKILPRAGEVSGIYNLTDGCHPTFKELEGVISSSLGKKKPITISLTLAKLLARVGDIVPKFPINSDKLNKITSHLTFDDSKARYSLGWKPSSVLDKIQETL